MKEFNLEDITIDDLPECCICLEQYVNDDHEDDLCSKKHSVCGKCIVKVDKCPMCREQLREPDIVPDEY
jgi:hypothetical protein